MTEILVIDVGNSNVKYALFKNGKLTRTWRHATASIKESAADIVRQSSSPVAISSVVPEAEAHLRELLSGRKIVEINALSQTMLSGMDETMGADRVADAVAAWKIHGKGKRSVAVVGTGTATTILAITRNGHVLGGWIAPGLAVTLEVLHDRCALLPLLEMKGQSLELGYDTDTHMRNGVFAGHIGLVREWLALARKALGGRPLTVGTGGWSKTIQEHGGVFDVVDPELTLKGIYLIARDILRRENRQNGTRRRSQRTRSPI
ncbi:MAG TPA: type III pantothenate kinase [Candidatus Obscuribacterales bacterium]